jgi:hypothetical protein
MKNTNNYREVNPTAKEIDAMKNIMSGEIQKMIAMGMTKDQIFATLKMNQHELSQKAFRAAK